MWQIMSSSSSTMKAVVAVPGAGEASSGAGEITFGADKGEFFDPDTDRGDVTFGDDEGSEFVSAPDPDRAIQTKSELTNERFT